MRPSTCLRALRCGLLVVASDPVSVHNLHLWVAILGHVVFKRAKLDQDGLCQQQCRGKTGRNARVGAVC